MPIENNRFTAPGKINLFIAFGQADYRQGRASHGYLPEKGPQPVFCANGPAFKTNYVGPKGKIYDLAPTLAAAMGIPYFSCDGTARTDLLNK